MLLESSRAESNFEQIRASFNQFVKLAFTASFLSFAFIIFGLTFSFLFRASSIKSTKAIHSCIHTWRLLRRRFKGNTSNVVRQQPEQPVSCFCFCFYFCFCFSFVSMSVLSFSFWLSVALTTTLSSGKFCAADCKAFPGPQKLNSAPNSIFPNRAPKKKTTKCWV